MPAKEREPIVRWRSLVRAQRVALDLVRRYREAAPDAAHGEDTDLDAAAAGLAECWRRAGFALNRRSTWLVLAGEQWLLAAVALLHKGGRLAPVVDPALGAAIAAYAHMLAAHGHRLLLPAPLEAILVRRGWLDPGEAAARNHATCLAAVREASCASVSAASLCAAGLTRHDIRVLRRRGLLARVSHGRYQVQRR